MGEASKFSQFLTLENQNLKLGVCLQNIKNSKINGQMPLDKQKLDQKSYYYLQNSVFLVFKILNSGIILKTFTHEVMVEVLKFQILC